MFREGICSQVQLPREQDCKKHLEEITEKSSGTAMFLIPDPEKGNMAVKVVLIKGLTYFETVERSRLCVAAKWIPDEFKSYEEVKAAREQKDCFGFCPGGGSSWNTCSPWYCMCDGFSNWCR